MGIGLQSLLNSSHSRELFWPEELHLARTASRQMTVHTNFCCESVPDTGYRLSSEYMFIPSILSYEASPYSSPFPVMSRMKRHKGPCQGPLS
jgi:hypothetical protein